MTDTTPDDETATDQARTDRAETDATDEPEARNEPDAAGEPGATDQVDTTDQADSDREPAADDERATERSPASDGGNWEGAASNAAGERERRRGSGVDRDGGRDLATYVEWAAFGILCLLALVATFRFYFAASEAIRVWFSPDFVPVFQAVFNLLVLVAAAAGISVLVRRIA